MVDVAATFAFVHIFTQIDKCQENIYFNETTDVSERREQKTHEIK